MRDKKVVRTLSFVLLLGLCDPLYGWEKTYTHPSISERACTSSRIQNYLKAELGFDNALYHQLAISNNATPFVQDLIERGMDTSLQNRTISEWIKEGSKLEDAKLYQARSQHHFLDPTHNVGLDNRTDHPNWEGPPTRLAPFDLRGESTLAWATIGTSSTGYAKDNLQTWGKTTARFLNAVCSVSNVEREQYLAEMFIAFGHVLHLLEDMGVPAHTRNDWLFSHYRGAFDNGNPFESWVEDRVKANDGQSLWSGSGPVVFDKLAEYFDVTTMPSSGE